MVNNGKGILPGSICESCVHLRPMTGVQPCPYGNSRYPDNKTMFVGFDGTPGSLCYQYITYDDLGIEANKENTMKKESSKMTDSELNVELYRLVLSMNEKERSKLKKYWDYIFPDSYVNEMIDDRNKSESRNKVEKSRSTKNKFNDDFKKGEDL